MGTIEISLKTIPIKAYNLVGLVKQYYRLIRHIYKIISVELPDIDKEMVLQIAFKAINNTTRPDGLISTLLIFGMYLKIIKLNILAAIVT